MKLARASRQPVPMRYLRGTLLDLSHEIVGRVAERRKASRITAFGVGLLSRIYRENVWIARIGNRRAVLRRVDFCHQWLAMDTERENESRASRERTRLQWRGEGGVVSIEWHEHTATEDVSCQLCCRMIRQGWTCCENTTDFDGPDWFHPECLAVTDSWTPEQWDDYWNGCLDLDAIDWPTYDEHGNVVAQPPGAKPMSIEPSPVVTREHQDRAAEIVEQMALKARDYWRGLYAVEGELWQRLQQLRRTRDDVRMGCPITIAKVLREAADPPCVSCGSPRSQGCEDPTACGVAALPFSQHCDATRDCNDYVCVQDVRSLIPPERWPELERLHMLEVHECGRCNGHGKYPGRTRSCPECGGTGKQIIAGDVRQ